VIDRQMQKNWNAKLLAFGGNTPQVFWCKDVCDGARRLQGKKVRVFNNTMRDFLGGVGATAVSMAFAEVVSGVSAGRGRLWRHRQPVRATTAAGTK
jgi:TRAP-type C4-dicarboxylate transport system substrate-binding protein